MIGEIFVWLFGWVVGVMTGGGYFLFREYRHNQRKKE